MILFLGKSEDDTSSVLASKNAAVNQIAGQHLIYTTSSCSIVAVTANSCASANIRLASIIMTFVSLCLTFGHPLFGCLALPQPQTFFPAAAEHTSLPHHELID